MHGSSAGLRDNTVSLWHWGPGERRADNPSAWTKIVEATEVRQGILRNMTNQRALSCPFHSCYFSVVANNVCWQWWQAGGGKIRHPTVPFLFGLSFLSVSQRETVLVECVHIKKGSKNSWVWFAWHLHWSGKGLNTYAYVSYKMQFCDVQRFCTALNCSYAYIGKLALHSIEISMVKFMLINYNFNSSLLRIASNSKFTVPQAERERDCGQKAQDGALRRTST